MQRETAEGILFTDFYQLTMAQLYFRAGLHERPAQFDHFFRRYPDYGQHQAGYCVSAGLEPLVDWLSQVRVCDHDVEYLRAQRSRSGAPLFAEDFLSWFRHSDAFQGLSLQAIPEGRVVHANVPLTVVQGPLAMAQILESPLLAQLNYATLVATKAARLRHSCGRGLILEFGMRRAHDRGANAGTRAALIGGADYTSNTGTSCALGLPPKGTHAHSMVQLFMALGEGELGAFRAFAEVYPDDCILLVDTVNTLESGVPNAIRVFEELRRRGHRPVGVRLDSGDLAHLAVQTARQLDRAGFPDTVIVLSNELDELNIWQIQTQIRQEAGPDAEAVIGRLVYGVGTRLITSAGHSAMGGVYKLVAVQHEGQWTPALKLSESAAKTPNPGHKASWRIYDERGKATADLLCLSEEDPQTMRPLVLHHPLEPQVQRVLAADQISGMEQLLLPILRQGKAVYEFPDLESIRRQRRTDVERLDVGVTRLVNPHRYHVSLSPRLHATKQELIERFSVGAVRR